MAFDPPLTRWVLAASAWLWWIGSFPAPTARAQNPARLTEYQVEAAFLYHFAKYASWPPRAFSSPTAPFVIGVLGENPFGDELVQIVAREKSVQGRPLAIVHGRTAADITRCHIVFISASEQPRLSQHFLTLERANSSALTVGETEDFLRAGGAIRFVVENKKVRFDIRAANAERAGVVVSSKLLSLARNRGEKT